MKWFVECETVFFLTFQKGQQTENQLFRLNAVYFLPCGCFLCCPVSPTVILLNLQSPWGVCHSLTSASPMGQCATLLSGQREEVCHLDN